MPFLICYKSANVSSHGLRVTACRVEVWLSNPVDLQWKVNGLKHAFKRKYGENLNTFLDDEQQYAITKHAKMNIIIDCY